MARILTFFRQPLPDWLLLTAVIGIVAMHLQVLLGSIFPHVVARWSGILQCGAGFTTVVILLTVPLAVVHPSFQRRLLATSQPS